MCGIIGAVSKRSITKVLVDGLKKLEYRGYDSAGIAIIDNNLELKRLRVAGKVKELDTALQNQEIHAYFGIAHTRWATHGIPSEQNAHPFISHDDFALVHNGIIENHAILRTKLLAAGYQFCSETDTETVVHLIHYHFTQTKDFLTAVQRTVNELEGAYALGVISKSFPNRIIGVRHGAPLVVAKGNGEYFIESDPLALLSIAQQVIYLEDHDIADVTLDYINIYDKDGNQLSRDTHTLTYQEDTIDRGKYRHYMMKEIMEQPEAITSSLDGRTSENHLKPAIFGQTADAIFSQVEHVQFVACGTSYHAAMIASYWIESLVNLPCSVEVASEFRYRNAAVKKNCLYVTLSQSGETADTLAALRQAKSMGYLSNLVICNVNGSTMMREADLHFLTRAGIEIGVASTKSYITQLNALMLLALSLRRARLQQAHDDIETTLVAQLLQLPMLIRHTLQLDSSIISWAKAICDKQHAIFLGRGILYPNALEGALKLKEISYIHAEGYPSGELKHGPLALIDNNMPVIATLPGDKLFEKTLSNLNEVCARGGQLYLLTDQDQVVKEHAFAHAHVIRMPGVHPLLTPVLYTVPLQLLAYHVAVLRGTDVDQPRNLAKSVTVE